MERLPRFCAVRACQRCFGSFVESPIQTYASGVPLRRSKYKHFSQYQACTAVGVVSPDPEVSNLVNQIFEPSREFMCCGTFTTAKSALQTILTCDIRVAIVEMALPDICGIQCIRQLAAYRPNLKSILITTLRDPIFIEFAIASGVEAFLVKPLRFGQLLATTRFATYRARGKSLSIKHNRPYSSLNESELQFLDCIEKGFLYKEMPQKLAMTQWRIRKLQRRVYHKLHAQNRMEAVRNWRSACTGT